MDNFQYLDFLNNTFHSKQKRKKQKVNLNRDIREANPRYLTAKEKAKSAEKPQKIQKEKEKMSMRKSKK